jgi:hypothetical protein
LRRACAEIGRDRIRISALAFATSLLSLVAISPETSLARDAPSPTLAPSGAPSAAPAVPTPVATILPAAETPAPSSSPELPSLVPAPAASVPLPAASAQPRVPLPAAPESPAATTPAKPGPGRALYAPLRYFLNTKWSCETFGGSNESHYYVHRGPYGFTLHNIFRVPGGGGFLLDETYTYDWRRHTWKATLGHGRYRLTAVRLTDNDWIFEGTETKDGLSLPFRMRYHMYDDVIFRRDFETLRAGTWIPFSGETCERNDFADVKM